MRFMEEGSIKNMNRYILKVISILLVVFAVLSWQSSNASTLSVAQKAAQEIFELVSKKLGYEGTEEITQKIGREGLENLLEKAAKEGGEETVEKIVQYGGSCGESALRAIRKSPVAITRCLDDIGTNQIKNAIYTLNRNPDLFTNIVEKYGSKALKTEMRHPGVGGKLVSVFGDDAIKMGSNLTTDQMIRFARHSDDVVKLSKKQSSALLQMLRETPEKVLDALESHPRVLKALTVLGIAVPVGCRLTEGTKEIHKPDGTEIRTSGPLHKMLGDAGKGVGNGLKWGLLMLFSVFAIIILLKYLPEIRGKGK